MSRIIRYFSENKLTILKIVGITIVVLLIIQLLNQHYKNQDKEKISELKDNIGSGTNTTIDTSNYIINQNSTTEENDDENIKKLMKEYVDYCNSKKYLEAYDILTVECKEKEFKTKQQFKEKYVDKIFNKNRIYTMQAWDQENNKIVYVVHFMEDALTTGKAGTFIEDYYTFIKQEDGNYKININNYIYSETYGNNLITTDEDNDISIQVLSNDVYKEYVIYEFKVYNNTNNKICINGDKSDNKIYLTDNKGVIYSPISSSVDLNNPILIEPGTSAKCKIKFNKVYNTNVKTKKLVLNDVILNYDEFILNTENYINRTEIRANI